MFASQTQKTIPVPFDLPETVTIRKLTGREYDEVCEAHRSSITSGRANAWPAVFRKALSAGASDPDVLKALADPLTGHDRFALVRSGLIACSRPLPTTTLAEAVNDLDDEAVDFIATEVLRLTKPALFIAVEAVEDALGEPTAAAPAA